MKAKKIFFLLLLLMASTVFYAQTKGIAYQAVLFNPVAQAIPGVSLPAGPLLNTQVCLRFSFLDSVDNIEYQEVVTVTSDSYGIVNTTIGLGKQVGGYASSFNSISWNTNQKTLVVDLDISSTCSTFEEISRQQFATAPFSFSAVTADNITGVAAIKNGGTGATNAIDARANLGLGNVNNTSDLNKPISTATQSALNLKEDIINKSTNVALDATSDVKYPTVKALKTYVDSHNASGGVADGGITTIKIADGAITDIKVASGISPSKVGLGNVDNTSDLNKPISIATQSALDFKENIANKSTATTLGNSNVLYPSQNAVKTYVDNTITTTTLDMQLKSNVSTNIITDAGSLTKYPSVKIIKDYVDSSVVNVDVTTNGGLTRSGTGTAADPYKLKINDGTTNGQILTWDGTKWVAAAPVDGIIGNEVTDAVVDGGLTRTGAGTTADPYKLKINDGTTNGQILTWDGTKWVAAAPVDGIIGNEVTDAVADGGLTRSGTGTAADPYKLKINDGTANEQVLTWDGSKWIAAAATNWKLTGNAGTTAGTNFIGTTDAQDLVFKTNDTEKLRILSNGNLGIATLTPASKLDIKGPIGTPLIATASNITLDNTHAVVKVNATLSDVNVTLPDPTTVNGRTYIIIKTDSSINKLIFNQTITGNEFSFNQANVPGSYQIQSDGSNWNLIK